MENSNLISCANGHMFNRKRYGTVCPYCDIETANSDKKARSEMDIEEELFRQEIKPVCGWLVCIEGPNQGRDFRILQGKNFIGTADDMHIQILGDPQIARRNHAIVVFEAKGLSTVLLPGDSDRLVYLNETPVYTPMPLEAYDKIELGESVFAFIPFCGTSFMWAKAQNK